MAHYIDHYEAQIGGGISRIYVGAPNQRGHGIGSFLGGLFRRAIPLLKRGARVLGREVLRSGTNFMSDLDNDVPWRQAFKSRATETAHNLKRKAEEGIEKVMKGEGYKLRYGGAFDQSGPVRVPRRSLAASTTRKSNNRKTSTKAKKKGTSKTIPRQKKKDTKGSNVRNGNKKCCRKRPVTDIFGPL